MLRRMPTSVRVRAVVSPRPVVQAAPTPIPGNPMAEQTVKSMICLCITTIICFYLFQGGQKKLTRIGLYQNYASVTPDLPMDAFDTQFKRILVGRRGGFFSVTTTHHVAIMLENPNPKEMHSYSRQGLASG